MQAVPDTHHIYQSVSDAQTQQEYPPQDLLSILLQIHLHPIQKVLGIPWPSI